MCHRGQDRLCHRLTIEVPEPTIHVHLHQNVQYEHKRPGIMLWWGCVPSQSQSRYSRIVASGEDRKPADSSILMQIFSF